MTTQEDTIQRLMQLTEEEKGIYLFSKIEILEIEVKLLSQETKPQERERDKRKEIIENLSGEIRKYFELFKQGYKNMEIAEKLEWSYAKACYYKRQVGRLLESPDIEPIQSKRKFSQEDLDTFVEMNERGCSNAEMSQALGRSKSSIAQLKCKLKKNK